jgi:hypothetical protein
MVQIILSSTLDTIVAQLSTETAVSTLRFLSQFDDSKIQASCFRCICFIAAEWKRQIHSHSKNNTSVGILFSNLESDIIQLDIENFMHILRRMRADQNVVHNFAVSSTMTSTDVDSSLHVALLPGNGQLVLSQSDFVHALSGSRVAVGSFISDVVDLDQVSHSNSDHDHDTEALFMLKVCFERLLMSSDRIQFCDDVFRSIPMFCSEHSVGSFQLILQRYSARPGFVEMSNALRNAGMSKFRNEKPDFSFSRFQYDDTRLLRAPMLSHTVVHLIDYHFVFFITIVLKCVLVQKSRNVPVFLKVMRDGAGFELCVQAIDNSVSLFRTDVWLRTVEGRVYLSDGSFISSMHVLPSGNLFLGLHGGMVLLFNLFLCSFALKYLNCAVEIQISIAVVQSTSIELIPFFWRLEFPHNAITPINDQQFVVAIGSKYIRKLVDPRGLALLKLSNLMRFRR